MSPSFSVAAAGVVCVDEVLPAEGLLQRPARARTDDSVRCQSRGRLQLLGSGLRAGAEVAVRGERRLRRRGEPEPPVERVLPRDHVRSRRPHREIPAGRRDAGSAEERSDRPLQRAWIRDEVGGRDEAAAVCPEDVVRRRPRAVPQHVARSEVVHLRRSDGTPRRVARARQPLRHGVAEPLETAQSKVERRQRLCLLRRERSRSLQRLEAPELVGRLLDERVELADQAAAGTGLPGGAQVRRERRTDLFGVGGDRRQLRQVVRVAASASAARPGGEDDDQDDQEQQPDGCGRRGDSSPPDGVGVRRAAVPSGSRRDLLRPRVGPTVLRALPAVPAGRGRTRTRIRLRPRRVLGVDGTLSGSFSALPVNRRATRAILPARPRDGLLKSDDGDQKGD